MGRPWPRAPRRGSARRVLAVRRSPRRCRALCAICSASAMKKRASKRRGRPGGVMARATKSSASSRGITPWAKKRAQAEERVRGTAVLAAPTRIPVSSKVSRMAARRQRARSGRCWCRPRPSRAPRASDRWEGEALSPGSTPPARKNEAAGKEDMALMRVRPSARESSLRRGERESATRRPWAGKRGGAGRHRRTGTDFPSELTLRQAQGEDAAW